MQIVGTNFCLFRNILRERCLITMEKKRQRYIELMKMTVLDFVINAVVVVVLVNEMKTDFFSENNYEKEEKRERV